MTNTALLEEIPIRQATIGDLEPITHLVAEYPEALFQHHDYSYLMMLKLYPTLCLVAECEHRVVGLTIGCNGGAHGEIYFLWQLAVESGLRGHGLGTKLILSAIANARALGCSTLECTITTNESKSAFEKAARALGTPLRQVGEMRFREPGALKWISEKLYRIELAEGV